MKKLLTFIAILLFTLRATAQVTNSKVVRVLNNEDAFGTNLPVGTLIENLSNNKVWQLTAPALSTADLSSITSKILVNMLKSDAYQTKLRNAEVLDMQTYKVVNLGAPDNDYDAATKKYVDDNMGTSGNGLWEVAGAIGSRLKTAMDVDIQDYNISNIKDIKFKSDQWHTITVDQSTSGIAGNLTVKAGDANTNTQHGADLRLTAGAGGASSDTPTGGNVYMYGHTGDVDGSVILGYDGTQQIGKVGIGREPNSTLDVNGSLALTGSVSVNDIENTLSDNAEHLPTSHAVFNAIQTAKMQRDEFSATNGQTNFALHFTLSNISGVFVNGQMLTTNEYGGVGTTTLVLNNSVFQYDQVIVVSN